MADGVDSIDLYADVEDFGQVSNDKVTLKYWQHTPESI